MVQKELIQISAPTWNELSDISHSVLYIQAYCEHIIKKHEALTYKSPIRIYGNKIENRITFKQNIISSFNAWNDENTMVKICFI